ncbi:MAG: hypothetical protein LBN40_00960 [Oscillospiraceae bacterium]|jgi:hypothetical protein|nr:hypothetical protein [Oscillospiraceae bacterium]
MTIIFLISDSGEKQSGIERLILRDLTERYTVTFVSDEGITRLGTGYELLVRKTANLRLIDTEECIVLMEQSAAVPTCALPQKSIIIASSADEQQLADLAESHALVITYGYMPYDTLTCTGCSPDTVMLALGRSLKAFSGKTIEPLETPAPLPSYAATDDVMAYTALRLVLDDFDSDDMGQLM